MSMARLRQAMSEDTTERLGISVQAPDRAPTLVSVARPVPQAGATMFEGDAGEIAAQIVAVLRERGALVS